MKYLLSILCLFVLSCDEDDIYGCTDANACNYNPNATIFDVSCIYEPEDCLGICGGDNTLDECGICDDDLTNNCIQDECGIWGGNGTSCNFGCTDPEAYNYDSDATDDDGSCYIIPLVYGCTDETACNYNPIADADNGECEYDACLGCTDPTACNYDVSASQDDGSCVQPAYECLDGTIKCHESECDI